MAGCPGCCGYYLSLCILKCLSGRHNALCHMLLKKKMKCEWFQLASQQVLHSFPLADLPACHPVGLMLKPSGLAVESYSSGQAPCVCQFCLPLTSQCKKCSSTAAFAVCVCMCEIVVCREKGGRWIYPSSTEAKTYSTLYCDFRANALSHSCSYIHVIA